MSAAGDAQLAAIDAANAAQAEVDRANRARYAEQQVRRRAAARDARENVKRARLNIEAAQEEFDRVAVAERLNGTASEQQLVEAWTAVDRARMRVRAAEAVAEALGGPGVA